MGRTRGFPRRPKESRNHLAIDDKFEDEVHGLIETGKEKGYLTYGEVNDALPDEIGSPDDLDDLMTTISGQGIDLWTRPSFPAASANALSTLLFMASRLLRKSQFHLTCY